MPEIADQSISLRVTARQKADLTAQAERQGVTLTQFVLDAIAHRDAFVRTAAQLEVELKAERDQRAAEKSTLQKALDDAKSFGENLSRERQEEAARQALESHRQALEAQFADEPSEAVRELRAQLAAYESPALLAVFEQVKGKKAEVADAKGRKTRRPIRQPADVVAALLSAYQPQTVSDDE